MEGYTARLEKEEKVLPFWLSIGYRNLAINDTPYSIGEIGESVYFFINKRLSYLYQMYLSR